MPPPRIATRGAPWVMTLMRSGGDQLARPCPLCQVGGVGRLCDRFRDRFPAGAPLVRCELAPFKGEQCSQLVQNCVLVARELNRPAEVGFAVAPERVERLGAQTQSLGLVAADAARTAGGNGLIEY